jgi:hypothetical protein
LYVAGFFTGDSQLLYAGTAILNAATVAFTIVRAMNFIVGAYTAYQAGSSLSVYAFNNQAIGPTGLLFQITIAWGVFVYTALTSGLFNHPNGIGFNMALAFAVATTIVTIILFAISLIPIVGQIIIFLQLIYEGLAFFFDWPSAQGALTTLIADALYDVDFIIRNLESGDRLDFQFSDAEFLVPGAGFTTDQIVRYSLGITNTLNTTRITTPGMPRNRPFAISSSTIRSTRTPASNSTR